MAKTEKKRQQEPRKQEFTNDDLKALADSIKYLAGEIDALTAEMEQSGIDTLGIDGATKPDSARELLRAFIANAEKSLKLVTPPDVRQRKS